MIKVSLIIQFCHFFVIGHCIRKLIGLIQKKMLDTVMDFYRGLDRYLGIRKNTSFFPFVMLIIIRKELRLFFERNSLPLELINDVKKWRRFLFLLLAIIIDCPLISNSGFIRECMFVDFESKENIICKLKLQDGNTQTFVSKIGDILSY